MALHEAHHEGRIGSAVAPADALLDAELLEGALVLGPVVVEYLSRHSLFSNEALEGVHCVLLPLYGHHVCVL